MGVVGLTFFAPMLSRAALAFGPPEYFALTFLGLSLVVSLSGKDIGKGLLAALFGLLTAVIGLDPLTGVARLTFGSVELMAGIDFVPIIMGLFAISEILSNAEQDTKCILDAKRIEWLPTWQDIKDTWAATIRSGVIGFLAGLIPGCSPAVTSFMVYDLEKRFSKHPEKFGHGAMDAVAAVEGSNNATASGGFVPLFAFGIPSGPALAVLLGGFLMYGLQPGPRLMQEQPALLWTIIASMYIGNVMLLVLNLPLVGLWARMALIPFPILGPMIAVFTLIGAYSLRHSFFDLWICLFFGVVGYLMRKFEFPVAPMVLATVLAKLMETSFTQSLVMSKGSPLIFFTRPISIAFILLTARVGGQRPPPAPQGQGPADRARGERLVNVRAIKLAKSICGLGLLTRRICVGTKLRHHGRYTPGTGRLRLGGRLSLSQTGCRAFSSDMKDIKNIM